MKKLVIVTFASFLTLLLCGHVMGQNQTVELSWNGSWNPLPGPTQGPSVAPQFQTFQFDNSNSFTTTAANFVTNTPALTVTTSLRNQLYTGYNYTGVQGTVTTGLSFGTSKSEWNDPVILTQGPRAADLYGLLGANVGSFGPLASQYKSKTGALAGTIDPDNTQFGSDANGGVSVFSTVEPLREANVDKAGRYEYGELVITFSQPVINPVIHVASLGGSSWYLPPGQPDIPANWRIAYFTTELELQNTGVTSTALSGSLYFSVTGNKILNSAAEPNGDSRPGDFTKKGNSSYGAASGSVQINTGGGSVTQLVYKVFVRGAATSDYAFSFPKEAVGATRNPFYGDFWSVSYSLAKPTQQIFGNVFIDKDISDGDINKSFGLPNDRTNAGGLVYANLVNSAGNVVATVPVTVNGDYAFDNVASGTYTVQLSRNQGVVGQPKPATALPLNWVNTGEFIGSGPGSDGSIDGNSAPIVIGASNIVQNVNFGIKAGACTGNILYLNPLNTAAGYYGGFENTPAANNFHPTAYTNLGNGPGGIYARTPLPAANYSITTSPSVFNAAYSSYRSLGGNNQMVVTPAANQTVYYLIDSAGKRPSGRQTYFFSGTGSNFKGWFAKTTAADATVKIRIYDAEDLARAAFLDVNINVTGLPGSWVYWDQPWTVNYGAPNTVSQTKKIRVDIISVNGAPFSIDELCFVESLAGPVLPIDISEFVVSKNNCTANLVWKTSSELNSDKFEVEVSTGNNPVYAAAGTIQAAGNSSDTKTYQYSYQMQTGEVYYFRLKMIDNGGAFKYSDVRSASCSKGKAGIEIMPNPVKTSFTIRGMENGKNSIIVYASNGQLVKTQMIAQNQGDVDVSYLAPGMYTVKVTSENGNTVVSKLIKY